jgi:hypothetical protein
VSCNCVKKVEAQLRKATGDRGAILLLSASPEHRDFRSCPSVAARWRGRLRSGALERYPSDFNIPIAYCPFCGKEL